MKKQEYINTPLTAKGIIIRDKDGNIFCSTVGDGTPEEMYGRAEYIEHCVNHFDELVEAIKSAMRIKDLWKAKKEYGEEFDAENGALSLMERAFEEVLKNAQQPKD